MVDNLTNEQRSHNMSLIRSRWTTPEKQIHNFLKGHKIEHKMHPDIVGNPDLILIERKIVVFIHGCFWHKCPKCYIEPRSNKGYWIPKIEGNVKRDRKSRQLLNRIGYTVKTVWEHELGSTPKQCISKLIR